MFAMLPKSSIRNQKLTIALLLVLVSVVFGVTFALIVNNTSVGLETGDSTPSTEDDSNTSTLSFLPPPQNVETIIQKSDLVMVGTIKNVLYEKVEGPFDANNQSQDNRNVPSSNLAFTYYDVQVDQVISSRQPIKATSHIVLRVSGRLSENSRSDFFQLPGVGEHTLMLLGKNPDGKSFGPYWGPYSIIHMDGTVATYSDNRNTPITFSSLRSPNALLGQLKAAAK